MELAQQYGVRADDLAVAVKAVCRVFDAWRLPTEQQAALADVPVRTLTRMRAGEWSGQLTRDQTLRFSAIIGLYKGLHLYFSDELADLWVSRENRGDAFRGEAPVSRMIRGGLPEIMRTRQYVDAVRGGV